MDQIDPNNISRVTIQYQEELVSQRSIQVNSYHSSDIDDELVDQLDKNGAKPEVEFDYRSKR